MAISKKFRVFQVSGQNYTFSRNRFKEAINTYKRINSTDERKITNQDIFTLISDAASISYDAVRNWYKGVNGPSDVEQIKSIAEVLEINYMHLLIEKNEGSIINMAPLTSTVITMQESEKDLILQIYNKLIEFSFSIIGTNNFSIVPGHPELENEFEAKLSYFLKTIREAYQLLEISHLSISDETYAKLHRLITECRYQPGLQAGYAHFAPRWGEINKNLYTLSELEEDDILDDKALYELYDSDTKQWDVALNELVDEIGMAGEEPYFMVFGTFETTWDEFMARELCKTIHAIVKEDFPQYFGK